MCLTGKDEEDVSGKPMHCRASKCKSGQNNLGFFWPCREGSIKRIFILTFDYIPYV